MCIVAAGPDSKAQVMAVTWDEYEEEFYWFDALGLDPYPTEVTTHWMPFPSDPETNEGDDSQVTPDCESETLFVGGLPGRCECGFLLALPHYCDHQHGLYRRSV